MANMPLHMRAEVKMASLSPHISSSATMNVTTAATPPMNQLKLDPSVLICSRHPQVVVPSSRTLVPELGVDAVHLLAELGDVRLAGGLGGVAVLVSGAEVRGIRREPGRSRGVAWVGFGSGPGAESAGGGVVGALVLSRSCFAKALSSHVPERRARGRWPRRPHRPRQ